MDRIDKLSWVIFGVILLSIGICAYSATYYHPTYITQNNVTCNYGVIVPCGMRLVDCSDGMNRDCEVNVKKVYPSENRG